MIDPGTAMALFSIGNTLYQSMKGGEGSKPKISSSYDKQQQQGLHGILNDINAMKGGATDITQNPNYQSGENWLQNLFNDPEFFRSFEAPLQRDFEEQTIPNLANRFAGMGSGGATGSTAFRNALGREASNLHTNIAALRGGMQQQGVNQGLQYAQQPFSNLMQLYNQALSNPINNQYQPPSAGLGALSTPFAQGATSYWGGQGGGSGGGGGMSNNQSYANGGGNQYPMTDYYDQMFRQQGAY